MKFHLHYWKILLQIYILICTVLLNAYKIISPLKGNFPKSRSHRRDTATIDDRRTRNITHFLTFPFIILLRSKIFPCSTDWVTIKGISLLIERATRGRCVSLKYHHDKNVFAKTYCPSSSIRKSRQLSLAVAHQMRWRWNLYGTSHFGGAYNSSQNTSLAESVPLTACIYAV